MQPSLAHRSGGRRSVRPGRPAVPSSGWASSSHLPGLRGDSCILSGMHDRRPLPGPGSVGACGPAVPSSGWASSPHLPGLRGDSCIPSGVHDRRPLPGSGSVGACGPGVRPPRHPGGRHRRISPVFAAIPAYLRRVRPPPTPRTGVRRSGRPGRPAAPSFGWASSPHLPGLRGDSCIPSGVHDRRPLPGPGAVRGRPARGSPPPHGSAARGGRSRSRHGSRPHGRAGGLPAPCASSA